MLSISSTPEMGSGSSLGKWKCRWAWEPVWDRSCAGIQEAETLFSGGIAKRESIAPWRSWLRVSLRMLLLDPARPESQQSLGGSGIVIRSVPRVLLALSW